MMNYKKLLYGGIIIFVGSFLVGILGTVWGIYGSFDALKTSEGAGGIDMVGVGIENALLWTIFGIIGAIIGLVLVTIGGVKGYRQGKN
jgi:biopolymer transport protein ExbB/TolQ